ncbi:MAG: hypothetical protein FWH16_04160 [Oscillospiraceae bacterium]|nr:hypothetical protein [Oscillospiraceae bacterium]
MKEQTRTIKPLVVSSCIGLLAAVVLLLIAAWAVSAGYTANMTAFAVSAVFIGSLITALGAAAFFRRRYLVVGVSAALGFFLFVFLLGGIVYFRTVPEAPVTGMLIASLAAGAAAGLIPRRKR